MGSHSATSRYNPVMDISTLHGAILDNAAHAIIATAPDGVITVFNRAAERMLGYRASEMVGLRSPFILHDPVEVAARAEAFSRELGIPLEPGFEVFVARTRCGLPNEYEWTYLHKDGTCFPVLLSITAIHDEDGQITGFLGIAMDISERKESEEVVRDSEVRLNEAQRIAQVGSWELDIVSNRLTWSDEIFRIFEIDSTLFGASYDAFLNAVHPNDREKVNQAYTQSLKTRTPYEIAHRLLMPDGRVKWVNERCETFYDREGRALRSSGTVQDITARKQADTDLLLYASIFEHSGEAILISDSDNHILSVNPAFTRMTGYSLEDVQGKNPRMLASGTTPPQTYQKMWATLKLDGYWQGEIWDRRKDGSIYPKWVAMSAVRGQDGDVTHYVASFTDITERKAAEAKISRLAHHDALTGLFNRFSLQDRLEQALSTVRRERRALALMFIDMDRFKTINDTQGHAVGDELLIEVAKRLRHSVRESDIVARLGGDEFVVVLAEVADASVVARVADKILRVLGEDYSIGGNALRTTPSIGVAFYPDDGETCDALMKNADTAMYHAKSQGRNNIQFFTAEMNRVAMERLSLERDLRVAVESGQFELHYQPQLDGRDGQVVGVEALVRWRHPRDGLVPPDKFISIAEETGLIVQLGEWVLENACRQLRAWHDQGVTNLKMAVNLSAYQLRLPGLSLDVARMLDKHGLRGGDLELEVTESVAMENPEASIVSLRALRDLGVHLAIDDFGTGYSSLSYLKLLPIHTLKLDRSFVRDIESDRNDAAICTATIALAHTMGLTVVAEGVETAAQQAFLVQQGCDFLQGYLFSKPVPAPEALVFIQSHGPGEAAI